MRLGALSEPYDDSSDEGPLSNEPSTQLRSGFVTTYGYRTTIDDLVRRAIVESDSAATDVVMARLGGAPSVQALLARHDLQGVRIDRDERQLQTDTIGLTWKPEFVDPAVLACGRGRTRGMLSIAVFIRDARASAAARAAMIANIAKAATAHYR